MSNETKNTKFKVDLQLFNDGGATGGAEGSTATAENAPKVDTKPSGSNRRSKSGEFDNVEEHSFRTWIKRSDWT